MIGTRSIVVNLTRLTRIGKNELRKRLQLPIVILPTLLPFSPVFAPGMVTKNNFERNQFMYV